MITRLIVPITLAAVLVAGCTERPLDASKSSTPAPAPAPAKTGAAVTHLQIAPDPTSPHTVGRFDAATKTLVAGKGESGALMFGPYARLPAGQYRATFVVVAESEADGVEVARVDVSGHIPGKSDDILARAPVMSARADQTFALPFDARNPDHLYQFRVWTNGKGTKVSVKSVLIERFQ